MCDNCVRSGRMTQQEADAQRKELNDVLSLLLGGLPSGGDREQAVEECVTDFLSTLTGLGFTLGFRHGDNNTIVLGAIPGTTVAGGPARGISIAEWSADQFRELLGE